MLLTVCSCKHIPENSNHVYFKNVFAKIDSAALKRGYYYTKGDMVYLDSVFAARNAGISDIAQKYVYKMGVYLVQNKETPVPDFKTALVYADSAVNLLQNHTGEDELVKMYSRVLFQKGDIYFRIKNYDEAIRNYTLGKIIITSQLADPNAPQLNSYYHSMANVLYAQQKYLQAAKFFRMKYTYALNHEANIDPLLNFAIVQENMDNTGMCYAKAGLTDSAQYYYSATLDYMNRNEKKFPAAAATQFEIDRAVVYYNQAEILKQQKDLAGAESLYLKSIESSRQMDDSSFTIPLKLSLADVYIETNQFKKAGAILLNTTYTPVVSGLSTVSVNYYKLLSDYYGKTNQPLASGNSLIRAFNTRDSIAQRDGRFAAVDISREFENREQHILNETLKNENEIKNAYLLAAIILGAMSIFIALIVWFNLKTKSAYVKKLTEFNTEMNKQNEDLQQVLLSLEQSHSENNRIMRVVAHDLKNPISAVRSLVFSLLRKEQSSYNRSALEVIQATCIDSIVLIKDLLENKRKLSEIIKELVDMGRLIEQCTALLQIKAGEKNQVLKLQLDHPVIMMNRQNILRVISNIINNAIKFSPENTEIFIRLERKDNIIILSVHDSGIGIPTSMKEQIFTIHAGNSRSGTAGEESHGLGLSIAKKIIEEHDGRLWFESEAGRGSVFYVELPYHVN